MAESLSSWARRISSDREKAPERALISRYATGQLQQRRHGQLAALALTPVAAGYELLKAAALSKTPILSMPGQAALRVGGAVLSDPWYAGEAPQAEAVLRQTLFPEQRGANTFEVDDTTSPASLDNVSNYVRGVLGASPVEDRKKLFGSWMQALGVEK